MLHVIIIIVIIVIIDIGYVKIENIPMISDGPDAAASISLLIASDHAL